MAKPGDRSQQKLVRVFSAQGELEARLVQQLLRSAGIESMINAEVAPGLYPLRVGGLAKHEILVLESEAEEARRLISEQQEARGELAE